MEEIQIKLTIVCTYETESKSTQQTKTGIPTKWAGIQYRIKSPGLNSKKDSNEVQKSKDVMDSNLDPYVKLSK
ncbi:hypothetical protein [Algoriphagus sp. A40]|uniref:hypothetical protein n=1 Tax=Algoriphagus sp. A40 TaxID=1945863 RepID=UPI00111587B6|nr:hypothetical protein [Algoriphagus sp. A40]